LLTIPVSIITDYFLHDALLSSGSLVGVGCIAIGFLILSFAEWREHRSHKIQI
jgi:hypothetical protein